jgi:hypothetical protein
MEPARAAREMQRNAFARAAPIFAIFAVVGGVLDDGLHRAGEGIVQEKRVIEIHGGEDSTVPQCWLRLKNGDTQDQLRVPLRVFRAAVVGENFRKRRWTLAYEVGEQHLYGYLSTVSLFGVIFAMLGIGFGSLELIVRWEERGAGRHRTPLSPKKVLPLLPVVMAGMIGAVFAFHYVFSSIQASYRRAAYEAASPTSEPPKRPSRSP